MTHPYTLARLPQQSAIEQFHADHDGATRRSVASLDHADVSPSVVAKPETRSKAALRESGPLADGFELAGSHSGLHHLVDPVDRVGREEAIKEGHVGSDQRHCVVTLRDARRSNSIVASLTGVGNKGAEVAHAVIASDMLRGGAFRTNIPDHHDYRSRLDEANEAEVESDRGGDFHETGGVTVDHGADVGVTNVDVVAHFHSPVSGGASLRCTGNRYIVPQAQAKNAGSPNLFHTLAYRERI